jgi:hypothetical protein
MGSSHPAFSGWAVVKTERDFPAVRNKAQDHRIQCGGLFFDIFINYENLLSNPAVWVLLFVTYIVVLIQNSYR